MLNTESSAIRVPAKHAIIAAKKIWTQYNELLFNIHTLPSQSLESLASDGRSWLQGDYSDDAKYDDNTWYESPDYWYLRKIARMVRPERNGEGVFYDLGSGKGRILCIMARQPFKRVVGIELFEDLCQAARANIQRMRGRKAPVDILREDAASADMSDGTVYFLYNSFGPDTMREVLQNIEQSLRRHPRKITFIYYNAMHEDILKSCGWLKMFHAFKTFTHRQVSFWNNAK